MKQTKDPTINKLQEVAAELTGKEKSLYVCSGTQSNLCGILATCWERGCEIFVGDKSHIALYEQETDLHAKSVSSEMCFDSVKSSFKRGMYHSLAACLSGLFRTRQMAHLTSST